jgi:hypothetical protein
LSKMGLFLLPYRDLLIAILIRKSVDLLEALPFVVRIKRRRLKRDSRSNSRYGG